MPLQRVLALLLVLTGAFWLRLNLFATDELGQDGLVSVAIAWLDLERLFSFFVRDIHPPLYYAALGAWLHGIGPTFAATRFPSIALSVLTVAMFYRLLANTFGTRAGLAGAALLAVAPTAVIDGATVRDFTAGALLSCVTWLLLLRRNPDPSTRSGRLRAAVLAAATAASLYVWYFHAVSLMLQLPVAFRAKQGRAPIVFGCLLASPWYLSVLFGWLPRYQRERFGSDLPTKDTVNWSVWADGAGRSLLGDIPGFSSGISSFAVWLIIVVAGLTALWLGRRRLVALILAAGIVLGLGMTVLIAWQWGGADFVPRYFHPPLMFGLAASAVALATLPGRELATAGVILTALPGLVLFGGFQSLKVNDGVRQGLAASVTGEAKPGDALLSDNFEDFGYLLLATRGALRSDSLHASGASYWFDSQVSAKVRLAIDAKGSSGRIWWIRQRAIEQPGARDLEGALYSLFQPIASQEVQKRRVTRFASEADWQPVNIRYPGGLALEAVSMPATLPGCSDLPVALRWASSTPVNPDLAVYVHVLDAVGRRVGQDDRDLAELLLPVDRLGLLGWHTIPLLAAGPGNYRLVLGVYTDGGAVPTQDGRASVTLGEFRLSATCPSQAG